MFKKKKKEKEYIKSVFSELVSKDTVDTLLEEETISINQFKKGRFNYILFQVDDRIIEHVPSYIKKSIDIVIKNDGIVGNILSSFVSVFFRIEDDNKDIKCNKLIQELVGYLGENIKIIYGSTDGFIGNLGSRECLRFGPIIPGFKLLMQKLNELDYGNCIRVKENEDFLNASEEY